MPGRPNTFCQQKRKPWILISFIVNFWFDYLPEVVFLCQMFENWTEHCKQSSPKQCWKVPLVSKIPKKIKNNILIIFLNITYLNYQSKLSTKAAIVDLIESRSPSIYKQRFYLPDAFMEHFLVGITPLRLNDWRSNLHIAISLDH